MFYLMICGMLILFFAWLLLHALIYSKSGYRIIEGLEPSPTPTPSATAAAIPVNPAEIEFLKQQIATLEVTAAKLNATMTQNETGVKNNTDLVQKVVKSQSDTQTKLASMKSSQ
jgi:hypothetical protein